MIEAIAFLLVLCLLFCGVVIIRGCARHYNQEQKISDLKSQLRAQEASAAQLVVRRRKHKRPKAEPGQSSPSLAGDIVPVHPSQAADIIQRNIETRYANMPPAKRIMAQLFMPIAKYVLTTPDVENEENDKTAMQSMCHGIIGATTELARVAGVPLIGNAGPPN